MTDTAPCRQQEDRDRLADFDLPDLDDQVGTGPQAIHAEELMPT